MCHVKRDIVTIINKVTLLKEIDAVKRHSEYKFLKTLKIQDQRQIYMYI